ncbi:hypothetical protein [Fulvivirga sp.]|uniref:hypothetical protein n=1 Tax=Fulvivirga sp. TaxID=1931237 RepID=UPI0032EB20F4
MKIIFWNTHSAKDISIIEEILITENPDILFLAEFDRSIIENDPEFLSNIGYELALNPGCDRITTISNTQIKIQPSLQSSHFSVFKCNDPELHIIAIHLPSQMWRHMDALKEYIRDFRIEIDTEIGDSIDEKILIIGDFNVNPYEKPMVDFDGFLASNAILGRKKIKRNKTRSTYFNPTWRLYSTKNFPGTKYFERPSGSSYDILEFHYLDQVVLSRALAEEIQNDEIYVLERTNNKELLISESNKLCTGIDHLPLVYKF